MDGVEQLEKEAAEKRERDRKRKEEREKLKKEKEEKPKREEEERIRREKEQAEQKERERKRIEEEKRNREEEIERNLKQEEERLERERLEAEKKAEQERLRKEEEEREEEKRLQREAEEKRLREEAERERLAEEAARKREEERKRRDEERKERERLKKEAEEKAWRRDPNNWKPVVYKRQCDEVDGRKEYHGGISCVLTSPPGGLEEDDIQCLASDEVDSIITILENDERPVSSFIEVQSRKEQLHSEVPSRLYVPHNSTINSNDEIVFKTSKDGSNWTTTPPVPSTHNMSNVEKYVKGMAGIEMKDFTNIKAIVVSRPKSQCISVDRNGKSVPSTVDKSVKLLVPKDTFNNETEMRMQVQPINTDRLSGLITHETPLENVLYGGSVITLQSQYSPNKSIELDLLRQKSSQDFLRHKSSKEIGTKYQRERVYHLYASRDKIWRLVETDHKRSHNRITVGIPPSLDKVMVMEIKVSTDVPIEQLSNIAEMINASINKTTVEMLVMQMSSTPKCLCVRIVPKDEAEPARSYLENIGYNIGPGVCAEFLMREGQAVELTCSGNIELDSDKKIRLEYMSYKGGISTMLTIKVKDIYKQKDLPSFIGTIRCALLRDNQAGSANALSHIDVNITLPKVERAKSTVGAAKVRLPYYLTSMINYIAALIGKDESFDWRSVLETLMGGNGLKTGQRNALRKIEDEDDEVLLFKTILLDWMKAQQKHVDKIKPILYALICKGHTVIANLCKEFVKEQKVNASYEVLKEISRNATRTIDDIGKQLGLSQHIIQKYINAYPEDNQLQIESLLTDWRESDDVLRHDNVRAFMEHICLI